jgi:hypothetical protein
VGNASAPYEAQPCKGFTEAVSNIALETSLKNEENSFCMSWDGYGTKYDTNGQSAAPSNPQVVEINGRPVGTRTPDLYRVKVAL